MPARFRSARRPSLVVAFALFCTTAPALAQHEHHVASNDEQAGHTHDQGAASPSLLTLEGARSPSGTAWQPEVTPHHAVHLMAGNWRFMLHGLLFAGYDAQSGPRGDSTPLALGWFMAMATRELPTARLTARVMLSPDPLTVFDGGYPLLLQTGETYNGQPLQDRQHPHDLFMELALIFTQRVTDAVALQFYAAAAGEPALGPVAFPHRFSAMADPVAALSHHWQDSTHISFGVLTAAVVTRYAKLEGSWFNGREPDEHRYDLDLRKPDSYSVRLSVNPTAHSSVEASYGHLASPEALRPAEAQSRLVASFMYTRPLFTDGFIATTAVFGRDQEEGHGANAYLVETSFAPSASHVVFGRAELVQKRGADLVLTPALDDTVFDLGAVALGYLYNFCAVGPVLPGVGARGAVNFVPAALESFYGSRNPVSGMVYLRLVAAPSPHAGHAM